MTTNVPPEPDEFQTRLRQSAPEGDVEATNRSASQSGQAPQPQPGQPEQAQPGQSPFAPPGFGGASQPQQPAQQPGQQAPAGYGSQQQTTPFGQPATPSAAPQGFGQQSFGQQSQAPQQPWGQQGQQQPAGYPQGGFGQQPGQPGPWNGGPQQPKDANPLKAAFDFGFGSYATPGIVKIVYIVGIALAVLWYLFLIIGGFQIGAPRDSGYGISTPGTPILGILAILFGWIPAVFSILVLRLALEQVLASVRTATDVRVLRERSDEEQKDS